MRSSLPGLPLRPSFLRLRHRGWHRLHRPHKPRRSCRPARSALRNPPSTFLVPVVEPRRSPPPTSPRRSPPFQLLGLPLPPLRYLHLFHCRPGRSAAKLLRGNMPPRPQYRLASHLSQVRPQFVLLHRSRSLSHDCSPAAAVSVTEEAVAPPPSRPPVRPPAPFREMTWTGEFQRYPSHVDVAKLMGDHHHLRVGAGAVCTCRYRYRYPAASAGQKTERQNQGLRPVVPMHPPAFPLAADHQQRDLGGRQGPLRLPRSSWQ
mmetsp:Transcript_17880/g.51220  ORF Transcript_17880/g.51220 Transcript_17880/m.51220 type:complete len:261 (-) Transcript_17880:4-786(-)